MSVKSRYAILPIHTVEIEGDEIKHVSTKKIIVERSKLACDEKFFRSDEEWEAIALEQMDEINIKKRRRAIKEHKKGLAEAKRQSVMAIEKRLHRAQQRGAKYQRLLYIHSRKPREYRRYPNETKMKPYYQRVEPRNRIRFQIENRKIKKISN